MRTVRKVIDMSICLIVLFFLVWLLSCQASEKQKRTGGPYYFQSVEMKTSSDIPLMPTNSVSAEEAKKLKLYGMAYYDQQGRLVSFTVMKEGKIDWSSEYFYSGGHIEKERYFSEKDGKANFKYIYDTNGSLIKREKDE